MKYRIIFWTICLGILFFSCLSNSELNTDFKEAPLLGKVYDRSNLPCANVMITLDDNLVTTTDINGRFSFASIKKGSHTIKFVKEGYREDSIEFEFLNQTQVVWWSMISLEQILEEIEEALAQNEYRKAYNYINEAKLIEESNPILKYLHSIYYYKLQRYELAVQKLESIIGDGFREPYVFLTITDIYEYNLHDYAKAYEYLNQYLELVDDRTARLRMTVIKGRLPKPEDTGAEGAQTEDSKD